MMRELSLFTDGGGEKASAAAGAAILRTADGDEHRLAAYFGGATNNEAEIGASLLGFSLIRKLYPATEPTKIHWVCDSEYVLKSATSYIFNWQQNGWKTAAKKPVKNQGLWRAYLILAQGYSITPEHVAGHSGHAENEACDKAATWAQIHAESAFEEAEDGLKVQIAGTGRAPWLIVDGRPYLAALRDDFPTNDHALYFLTRAIESSLVSLSDEDKALPIPKSATDLFKALKQLAQIRNSLERSEEDESVKLAEELTVLLGRFGGK